MKKQELQLILTVLVVREVPGQSRGDLGSVTAIKMDLSLIDIFSAWEALLML